MNSFICPISLSIHDKIVPNNDYESLNDKVVRGPQSRYFPIPIKETLNSNQQLKLCLCKGFT